MRLRIRKPNDNVIAHILAISSLTLIALIVFGLGRPSGAHAADVAEPCPLIAAHN